MRVEPYMGAIKGTIYHHVPHIPFRALAIIHVVSLT